MTKNVPFTVSQLEAIAAEKQLMIVDELGGRL